jgi:predicted transcriptional regulator of viral defense system
VLAISVKDARTFLGYLALRGWLARIRRGLYVTVPLDAAEPSDWREDPWIVAANVFSPCYIGGWSACEHWELTDQVFQEVAVVTARRARRRRIEVQGTPFRVKVVSKAKMFGTVIVWRRQTKVEISDPARTIIDVLDDPAIGGGLRHVGEVVYAYFAGEHRNDLRLIEYGDKLGNRTVFKRLGYLVETFAIAAPDLVKACQHRLSEGVSALDPTVRAKGVITKRWRLRVNVRVAASEAIA